jgi:hypothetical protein
VQEPIISSRDVTTIMALLVDMRDDIRMLREYFIEDDGEEEEEPPTADR